MESLLSAVLAEPELVSWLKTSVWKRGFDRGSLVRATDYRTEKILVSAEAHRVPGDSVTCEVKIRGSRQTPYVTRVGFFHSGTSWAVDADCSCPVGLFCKHGAAVVLSVLDAIQGPALKKAQAEKSTVPVALDPKLAVWLESIGKVTAEAETQSPPRTTANTRFLVFCLEREPYPQDSPYWRFVMRTASRLKSGGFTINNSMAQADPSNPPQYMQRNDFVPVSLFHQRRRKVGEWQEMRMIGGFWDDLLEAALATGRFHVAGTAGEWLAVTQGPAVPVATGWQMLPDGGARPEIRFMDGKSREILPTIPPRYLEPETGMIGMLESSMAPAALASWATGPLVPAAQILPVSKKLQDLSSTLPPPVELATATLPAVPPVPHLHIVERTVSDHYRPPFIQARVRFRYGDGPELPPMARKETPSHSEVRDGRRLLQPRDAAAERALEARLDKLGLTTLEKALNSSNLSAENRRIRVPDVPRVTLADWLRLVSSSGFQALRDEGWVIRIDPSTGLVFQDAGDFFPSLEADPDHGIDWFRFDLDFELDGERLSLIPFIAAAIRLGIPAADSPQVPEFFVFPRPNPEDGSIRFPGLRLARIVDQVRHLFVGGGGGDEEPLRVDRLSAAGVADSLSLDTSATVSALARLGRNLRNITKIPAVTLPEGLRAELRPYQIEGYRWLQFLAANELHGILADDMGLGKTLQTLAHLAAEHSRSPGKPSLVVAPTSVVPNWAAEAEKFTPGLKVVVLHGKDRGERFDLVPGADIVLTSYPLVHRDLKLLDKQEWHLCVLDEAQYIKNSKSLLARNLLTLRATHRLCLSGTPMENHLGELWSLSRFLMPGFLGDETTFNTRFRRPIEKERSRDAQQALNRRVAPLILRRTKDQVATELPEKTEILHTIELGKKQADLYESVRSVMDQRVRDAIAGQGLARSHIIVLDALLKLRQVCCHPPLLKTVANSVVESAKLEHLTQELLPTLIEEGRRILLFSTFTSMLEEIEAHLRRQGTPYLKLTGDTTDRGTLVKKFQTGEIPIFLISLKAGGTGLNLTAADTVIHYDPWWNPAAENQATDRAHRIGQTKPVFVHKLICSGTIEERIIELQKHKAGLVEALLSEETSRLKIDSETLSHLLAPLD